MLCIWPSPTSQGKSRMQNWGAIGCWSTLQQSFFKNIFLVSHSRSMTRRSSGFFCYLQRDTLKGRNELKRTAGRLNRLKRRRVSEKKECEEIKHEALSRAEHCRKCPEIPDTPPPVETASHGTPTKDTLDKRKPVFHLELLRGSDKSSDMTASTMREWYQKASIRTLWEKSRIW